MSSDWPELRAFIKHITTLFGFLLGGMQTAIHDCEEQDNEREDHHFAKRITVRKKVIVLMEAFAVLEPKVRFIALGTQQSGFRLV
ncbi:hypothetical protein BHE90_010127 [Fusarium euwallaceae]|uniref:Prion-inhibition and propagation HeLo domain-containing protein n=1 Tax=Fusarium euwallaceae TaxID=1147111 RepID=A0A430LI57_9HYPO|nr:hypothetical protein BHE90_010127 [Fusarium euwallaceae]